MTPAVKSAIAAAVALLKSHGFTEVEGTEGLCWYEANEGWVIKLSETGYELYTDGADEMVNDGPFEHLADELQQYEG